MCPATGGAASSAALALVPDGGAALRGIVGGYRLMEGRTVEATGNGCADRRRGCVRHRVRLQALRLCASRLPPV